MSVEPVEPKKTSRITSLFTAIKDLLAEDPLLALVAFTMLVPTAGLIVQAAIAMEWNSILPLMAIEAGTVIVVCIPLIITKTWKTNQATIADARKKALEAEGERRIAEEQRKIQAEKAAQDLVNKAMAAKLESLTAHTEFLRSQSDRHERALLRQTAEQLAENLKEGAHFITQEDFSGPMVNVLEEMSKLHLEYDTLAENLQSIIDQLNARTSPTSSDVADLETRYNNLWETHQGNIDTIADLQRRLEQYKSGAKTALAMEKEGAEKYQELQAEYDKLKAQLDEQMSPKEKLTIQTHSTERAVSDIGTGSDLKQSEHEKYQAAMKVVEGLKGPSDDVDLPLIQRNNRSFSHVKVTESTEDDELERQDNLLPIDNPPPIIPFVIQHPPSGEQYTHTIPKDRSEPEKLSKAIVPREKYWVCKNPRCKRANHLKLIRCPKCNSSRGT